MGKRISVLLCLLCVMWSSPSSGATPWETFTQGLSTLESLKNWTFSTDRETLENGQTLFSNLRAEQEGGRISIRLDRVTLREAPTMTTLRSLEGSGLEARIRTSLEDGTPFSLTLRAEQVSLARLSPALSLPRTTLPMALLPLYQGQWRDLALREMTATVSIGDQTLSLSCQRGLFGAIRALRFDQTQLYDCKIQSPTLQNEPISLSFQSVSTSLFSPLILTEPQGGPLFDSLTIEDLTLFLQQRQAASFKRITAGNGSWAPGFADGASCKLSASAPQEKDATPFSHTSSLPFSLLYCLTFSSFGVESLMGEGLVVSADQPVPEAPLRNGSLARFDLKGLQNKTWDALSFDRALLRDGTMVLTLAHGGITGFSWPKLMAFLSPPQIPPPCPTAGTSPLKTETGTLLVAPVQSNDVPSKACSAPSLLTSQGLTDALTIFKKAEISGLQIDLNRETALSVQRLELDHRLGGEEDTSSFAGTLDNFYLSPVVLRRSTLFEKVLWPLGYTQVTLNGNYGLEYEPKDGRAQASLRLSAHKMGTLIATLSLSQLPVSLVRPSLEELLQASPWQESNTPPSKAILLARQTSLDGARFYYQDASLAPKLLTLWSKKSETNVGGLIKNLITKNTAFWMGLTGDSAFSLEASDTLKAFLSYPKNISLVLAPKTPTPLLPKGEAFSMKPFQPGFFVNE